MKKVLAALIVTVMMFVVVFTNKGAIEALATPEKEAIPQETIEDAKKMEEVIQSIYTKCDSFYGKFVMVRNNVTPHENGDIEVDLAVYNLSMNELYEASCVLTPDEFSETYLSLLIAQSQVCEGA